jgi:iron complex transport system substrate-binding protein
LAPPSWRVRGVFDFLEMLNVAMEIRRRSREWRTRGFLDSGWRSWGRMILLPVFAVMTLLGLPVAMFSARLVTDQTGRRVSVPEHIERLVSLAPSITETLYALGLGDQLVGDTDYCEYPPEAKQKPHVGPILNPSLEKIVALKPDLVLGSPEANRIETADRLERLGIPLYGVTARSVEETLDSIEDLGRVLGREAEAQRLVLSLRQRIEAVERRVAGRTRPKVLFVVWYRPLTTAGARSFIGDVVRRAGGTSVSEDLPGEWPRLSLEEALRRDPDVILFPRSESFAPALEEFQRLPGWREFRAVRNRRMYFVSDAIVRPSPRLVDALEEVARALHPPQGARQEVER